MNKSRFFLLGLLFFVVGQTSGVDAVFAHINRLETDRLIIRPITTDDITALHELYSDPSVARFVSFLLLNTHIDESRAYVESIIESYMAQKVAEWAVVEKESNTLVGCCGFVHYWPEHARAELAYWYHKDFRGKGYAAEAARAVVEYGFTVLNLHRIEATVDPENIPSQKLLEKIGMRKEGLLREYKFCRGLQQYRDRYMYGLIRPDWYGQ